ncbi:MAG TPA: efflux RND transporter permease subunit [Gemmatimonadaceae bacterium]|nr:efflux RND transporter permease subunit [Gemmatimonadaceae bacterium]
MNFTALFIRRPVMTTLLMAAILVFGIVSYRKLTVSDLPAVDYPTISVFASLPGASAETMAATVATPLEKSFSAIAGIDNITSSSSLGNTNVTLQFSPDRDIDAAAQDVNAAISATLAFLPSNIIPPSYRKQNPAAAPILFFALTSSSMSLTDLDEVAETTIAQRLSMVEGVSQVNVWGSAKYAVRVDLDPAQLTARGLSVNEIAQAVRSNNVTLPTGVLYGRDRTLTIMATGQLSNAAQFRNMVVANKNGAPIHLGDLGRVYDGIQNTRNAGWYNGQRAIVLAVMRQPGTNTVTVATAVKQALADLKPSLPPSVNLVTRYDRSQGIQESVHDVKVTLIVALVLVVMVIFVFLRNVTATMIPSLTLPMAIVGTFSVMYALDFSIDNLSLMALTLAVGFVVDDAIVMLENIVRHLELGQPPLEAALEGAEEVGFTILSMTLSLAAVFIPLIFMGGVIGQLFREFAITISAAILVSGLVSLTLTPMLCALFLKAPSHQKHGGWFDATERAFDRMLQGYERSLGWAMRRRPLTLVFSALILVVTGVLFMRIPKGLFPSDDTGLLNASTQAAQGTSFEEMVRLQQKANAIVARDSFVDAYMSNVGGGNGGNISIVLKPQGQRPNADQMVQRLTRELSRIPGLNVFIQNPPSIRIGGRGSRSQYQYTLQANDVATLYASAQKLERAMRGLPLITDVNSDLENKNPVVNVSIMRDRAAMLGVTPLAIQRALANAFSEQQASTIYTPTDEYWVVMQIQPQDQTSIADLAKVYVTSSRGALVPLTDVATFTEGVGPQSIAHSGQLASVTISFNLPPNGNLGAAVAAVENLARRTLDASVSANFSGTAQAFQDSQRGLGVLLLITVFVIYIILGILYESFIHPVTILTGLPFAAFGALLALTVTGQQLDVYGYVGVIMLIGIVKKNAIMMIDFAIERERSEHTTPARAIVEAASVRFRPIMMTTVAAIAGTLPIAIGLGASGASRRPLGIAVVGGLAFSQIVTLYVTPVFYTYLDDLQSWLGRVSSRLPWSSGHEEGASGAPVPAGD